jgi:Zn-finger nucleic acid-binding protein
MQPEALNCPNCGGAVTSDKTQCAFCKSRLKTVGCPSCLGVMFLGSKFCSHCGAMAAVAELIDKENPGKCPRCKIDLSILAIDAIPIRECEKCGGFWLGVVTFETLCSNQEQQSAVLSFIGNRTPESTKQAPINYVPCPDCKQLMNRSNFARSSGVIIDLCKQHGVWFDADELPKIIDFIHGGGMARAREKEKIALDDERSNLRDEQRRFEMMERRSGGGRFSDPDKETGIGTFIDFLFG